MLRAVPTLAAVLALVGPATAVPPSPDPKSLTVPQEELSKARELVQKLGSETFFDREDAERTLVAMGRTARTALQDGASSDPDPEIRSRSRSLLPRANVLEMKARLDTFLADTDGKYEHDLPGWNKLRAVARGEWSMFGWTWATRPGTTTDRAARELFVEFLNAPGGRKLLTALGSGASDLGTEIAAMKQDLYYAKYPRVGGVAPRNPSVMEVAVVMFADSQVPFKGARNSLFTSVLTSSGIAQAARGTDDRSNALRTVLIAWFDSRTDPYEMYSALNLATNTQNNDAVGRMAVRLLGAAGAPAVYRGQAFAALVRLQSKEHLPAIEKFIGDAAVVTTITTNVGGNLVRTTITVGDMALAAAVLITGQKVEDYGIEDRLKGSATTSISYTRFSIPEDKRKDAAEKWKTWREKNP
ncbi:hypothetical protein J8F10_33975 [Gemmata sp. G18]|uniref:HEAT repeat domain-containing protein n=1 Tax=Gemmata palustris TaxID=2822762 RepID=A0ABS5C2P9_9BACT|nr:hypothetical protein [Gemmata palustris]MBP3960263.1 hypothetical protein [Gemmata palustris]